MNIKILSIDIAKKVFQFHGVDKSFKRVFSRKVNRQEVLSTVSELNPQVVVLESCGTSHYWGRAFEDLGLEVRLIAPQHVKPYVRGNKTDRADAAAIVEAYRSDGIKFVEVKSKEQQSIQALHRIREQLIIRRTATSNELRGLALEFGIILPASAVKLRKEFAEVLENAQLQLDSRMSALLKNLHSELLHLDAQVKSYDRELKKLVKEIPICGRLSQEPGVGPVIATAFAVSIGNPKTFKNARAVGAWLGLTPREFSSGGKQRLYGITKRGDKYLRKQMVHGARSVVWASKNRKDALSVWIQQLVERRGFNRAVVAVAHKMARQLWAIMNKDESWQPLTLAV